MNRIVLTREPFTEFVPDWPNRGKWPAHWITAPTPHAGQPVVLAFRLRFTLASPTPLEMHVSADERYELFLDGTSIGRGPERGDLRNWFYETYAGTLAAGPHTLVARVWWLGSDGPAPYAQHTHQPAFLLAAAGLHTGVAAWECVTLPGYRFLSPEMAWGTGARVAIDGEHFQWGYERGDGPGWQPVRSLGPAVNASEANEHPQLRWALRPATLPAMRAAPRQVGVARQTDAADWNAWLAGRQPVTIPAHTTRQVLIDLGDYYCAYPQLTTTGGRGARVRLRWAEALFESTEAAPEHWSPPKGNRDEVAGKHFVGVGDEFLPDGGTHREFTTLWWAAGRYVELVVTTTAEPVTLERLRWLETGYPFEFTGRCEFSDARLARVTPLATRALQMCAHETYMDCPYYEQLMYVGDTRLEALVTYVLTADDRLPRKAILMFDESRVPTGLTQSRYPSRVRQVIPPFSLWWIGMVHDYAMWRDDPAFVAARLPGVRAVLEAFHGFCNADGLVEAPAGWNFCDWVPGWHHGMAPAADTGVNGLINWQFVYTLRLAAELEDAAHEPELARRNRRAADQLATALQARFWDEARGLFAHDLDRQHFSEHTQCLALLAGVDDAIRQRLAETLIQTPGLAHTTIYFTHYLFEALRVLHRPDVILERLAGWFDLPERGLKTTVEMPEPSRSDCHAWGAHPLYHYAATLLGVRPAAPGFKTVRIEPQLGPLTWARGVIPHPRGLIKVELTPAGGTVELPPAVTGTLVLPGSTRPLQPGRQTIS